MKKQILFTLSILLASLLSAQENPPIMLVSAKGKVALIPEGKMKGRPVQSGALLKNTSQLKLDAGASAIVFCDQEFKDVQGGQTIALSSICNGGKGTRRIDADFEFGEKIMDAASRVAVAQSQGAGWTKSLVDPKKNGDGWGNSVTEPKAGSGWGNSVTEPKAGSGWGNSVTEPKAGSGWGNSVTEPKAGSGWGNSVTEPKAGSGWGGKGEVIRLILPFGKVDQGQTIFSWSKPANTKPYRVEIKDEAGNIVHTMSSKDTFVLVDLAALNLVREKSYYWKVSVEGSQTMISNELAFGVGDPAEKVELLKQAGASRLTNKAQNPVLSKLVEAVALENAEWFSSARQIYAELSQKNPDPLVRMMHSAFWMRNGYKRLGETAAKG